jgi:hypothetical protein
MLDRVVRNEAFAPSADLIELAAAHVSLRELSGDNLESTLFRALTATERPCAAEVVGPSGGAAGRRRHRDDGR